MVWIQSGWRWWCMCILQRCPMLCWKYVVCRIQSGLCPVDRVYICLQWAFIEMAAGYSSNVPKWWATIVRLWTITQSLPLQLNFARMKATLERFNSYSLKLDCLLFNEKKATLYVIATNDFPLPSKTPDYFRDNRVRISPPFHCPWIDTSSESLDLLLSLPISAAISAPSVHFSVIFSNIWSRITSGSYPCDCHEWIWNTMHRSK